MTRYSVRGGVGAEKFRQATGSAPTFSSIDGVGEKTARAVKAVRGIDAPTDTADMTADELATEAGISQSRAETVIRGAGGNPDIDESPQTRSVSAAGIRVPTGEFKTEISDKDKAEAKVDTSLNRGIGRSKEAARADKSKRAPVTTDYERWKNNKDELDYPGADTPTDDPKVLPKDVKQEQRPDTTAPDDPPARTNRTFDRGNVFQNTTKTEGVARGVTSGIGEESPESITSGLSTGGPMFDRTSETFRETDRPDQERTPPDIARGDDPFDMSNDGGVLGASPGGSGRQEFDLPDETLSFARTQLNEKVYGEGRDDLDDLRERVTPGESIKLDRSEFRTVKNVVFDAADEANERAERMDRNIFGDTDEQAAFADTARQGLINNPFGLGDGR